MPSTGSVNRLSRLINPDNYLREWEAAPITGSRNAPASSRAPPQKPNRLLAALVAADVDAQLRHHVGTRVLDELNPLLVLVEHLDVDAEALQLLDEHLEGFWHARLDDGIALDDRLVGLDAPPHVVRLYGQTFLGAVGGAIGFERPHLHLAIAL